MNIIKKIFKTPAIKALRKKRGQAVIEYTLLLVVGVGIAVGLKNQFMEPFKDYTESLFGEYYVCLMETAVLPGMNTSCPPAAFTPGPAADSTANNPASESYWQSSRSKKEPLKSSSSGIGSGGGGSSSSFPAAQSSTASSPFSSGIGSGGGGSSSSFPAAQSSTASSPFSSEKSSFPVKSNASKDLSSLDSSLSQKNSNRVQQSPRSFKVSKKQRSKLTSGQISANQGSSSRFLTSAGAVSGQENPESKIRGKSPIPAPAGKESSAGSGGKREQLILDEKQPPQKEPEKETSFNFGKWMKYILIAVVAGVILFFIGSQAAQMRENLKAS